MSDEESEPGGSPSLGALLREARERLARSPHVPDASQEALWFIMHVTDCSSADPWAHPERHVPAATVRRLRDLIERRASGAPLQHLLGDAHFLGRRFLCDARALIPRPETELLVSHVIARLRQRAEPRIADICTGTACIAISIALELPTARVVATDLSMDALALAAENVALHGVGDRVDLRQGDLFEPLTGEEPFDAVCINPPYIPADQIDALGPDIAAEPRVALDGGPNGLEAYRRIAAEWRGYVAEGGLLALEVGAGQMPAVRSLIDAAHTDVIADLQGIDRVLLAYR